MIWVWSPRTHLKLDAVTRVYKPNILVGRWESETSWKLVVQLLRSLWWWAVTEPVSNKAEDKVWYSRSSSDLHCMLWLWQYVHWRREGDTSSHPQPEAVGGHVRGTADGSWLQGVKPPGNESLIDGFQIGKAPRPQTAECCFLLLCLYMFPLPSFSCIWHGVNECEEIPTACNVACLSHRNILFY